MASTDTTGNTMGERKGDEYVCRWQAGIAKRFGFSSSYLARAITKVTGAEVENPYNTSEVWPAAAALTAEQVQEVLAECQATKDQLDHAKRHNCWECGRPLPCSCGVNESQVQRDRW